MYTLTLTDDERQAMNWVGYRYSHGDDLSDLLMDLVGDERWNSDDVIQFNISEHIAWQIQDIGEQDNFLWTCFSPEFAQKMNDFCDKII